MTLDTPIYRDIRGEINRYSMHGAKFNVLFTRKEGLRGGDYHPITQYDLILKGEFELTLRQDGKDGVLKKGANELIVIPPNVPHLFRSLTDTVMIEWWDGTFEVQYYEPYRKLIEEQFRQPENEV